MVVGFEFGNVVELELSGFSGIVVEAVDDVGVLAGLGLSVCGGGGVVVNG